MKFLLVSPKNRTVYNFRGNLIREIQAHGYDVTVTGPDQTDVDKIKALGVEFCEIPMNKNGTSILGDLRYCAALWKQMRRLKPDVVLGYTIKPVVYGTIAGWLAGVKNTYCLITGGGYTFTAKTAKAKVLGVIVRTLYKCAFRHSRQIIFQNADDRAEFIERRLVKAEKCQVVNGSGVDMTHFAPTPYPDEICFFMLSRLLKSKGVGEYLRAAQTVKARYPNVRFTLLGKYENAMQDAIAPDEVERLIADGVIERYDETSDVRPYYTACSVYVLPSYREGTPRTVLEAMAMARPIITTDTNGCRDTVKDGETGFLVPVGDADALAESMSWFAEHPDAIPKMGQAAEKYCREKFEVGKVNADMIQFLHILGG